MRRGTLLTQVLVINLLLIAAAVIAASIATNPNTGLRDEASTGMVLGFALAAAVALNVFMLNRRFQPLERLVEEMENANLGEPLHDHPRAESRSPEEVRRLERSFREMLSRLEGERRRRAAIALEAQERERARVALDLHDEVNQALTGLLLRIEALRRKAPPELRDELAETGAVATQAMEELLALARQLRPTALDDLGLDAALAGLVTELDRRGGIEASFELAGSLPELPGEIQLVAYRIAQEALSNAVQHAEADRVDVRLSGTADGLELRVTDDGVGFPSERAHAGLGIAGMRERALLVGGRIEIESSAGAGTRVRLTA